MYDFDEMVPRRGSNCIKWDARPPFGSGSDDIIPLWVADMDFKAAPCIIDALRRRVEHGVFGYVSVPDSYYEAVVRWFSDRHGWKIEKDWIIYTTGVVPALSAVIKAFSRPGDKVILQTPVYNCFFSSTPPWSMATGHTASTSKPSSAPAPTRRQSCSCSATPTTPPDAYGPAKSSPRSAP